MSKASEPLQKHTLFLFEGDFDKVARFHPTLNASVVIRKVIRSYIERLERAAPTQELEVKIDV